MVIDYICDVIAPCMGPTNVEEHFPGEELNLGKNRLLKVDSLVE